jgi:hypothetical protein
LIPLTLPRVSTAQILTQRLTVRVRRTKLS